MVIIILVIFVLVAVLKFLNILKIADKKGIYSLGIRMALYLWIY
jgi:hypothetical protein